MVRHSRFIPILILVALAANLTGSPVPVAADSGTPLGSVADLPLTVIPAAHSILLAWAPVAGAASYKMQLMDPYELIFADLDQLDGSATSYRVNNLAANAHYQLRVQVFDMYALIASGNVEVYTMPYQFLLPLVAVSNK